LRNFRVFVLFVFDSWLGLRWKGLSCFWSEASRPKGIMLGSGNNLSRGTIGLSSDTPNLSQVLTLEPIRLGNQNYTRSGELRRVLGVPSRASSEDNSFGMSHPRPSPPVATEELKHFKESVLDTSREAGYGSSCFLS
jgi:hypothetical protein